MKSIFTKIIPVLFGVMPFGLSLLAQPFNVDLTLKYNTATSEYEVYARSATTETFAMAGGSQVSLVLPASVADATLTITDAAGGPWTDNSQVYAPAAQSASDFHSIASNATQPAIAFVANTEIMLFKFTLAGGCTSGVRLYRNVAEGAAPRDPDSNGAGMAGGDYENFLSKISPYQQRYNANYNNTGIFCNTPPVINSNGGGTGATQSISENTLAATTVTATDADTPAQTLTYTVTGGADASKFTINPSTGVLTFNTAPNFESPTDVGANNVYDVQVTVSDGIATDVQDLAVTVTDVNEAVCNALAPAFTIKPN